MRYKSPDEFFKDNINRYKEIAELNVELAISIAIEDVWDIVMEDTYEEQNEEETK